MTQQKQKSKAMEIEQKKSNKSSSLISSSRSNSSDSSVSQSKYQKKQLQSSKLNNNDPSHSSKTERKQKKYNSRSRSHQSKSDRRSRSMKKKQKSKHRNRSRSRDHKEKDRKKDRQRSERYRDDRRNDKRDDRRDDRRGPRYNDDRDRRDGRRDRRDRDGKYDDKRDRRDNRQRGRSREDRNRRDKERDNKQQANKSQPTEIPMPLQIPMPPIPGQRTERRRQRSRSPLSYYRRNQNNNQGEFWDSFSWVPRINYTPNVSSSALVNTKKMRRLMITNIPYEMGIEKEDLRQLITRYMTQNYLKDTMNNCPVRDLELNEEDHTVSVQLSSVEETCRMCKLEKIQLFKGAINGIIRLGDSCYGNNVVTQAQNAAQAQAAAFAAINVLENKKTNFNMDINLNKGPDVSTLIRVANAVTTYMAENMTAEEMQDYHEDLLEGFSQYGKIVHNWFVKPNEKDVCANPGDLFIEYESQQEAMKAMDEMQGKFYDERVIKLFYVPREIYYPNFKKDLTPPTIKAPPKKKIETPLPNAAQLSRTSYIATKTA